MIYNFHGSYTEERKNAFTSAQEEDLAKISKYLVTDDERLRDISFEIFDTREFCNPGGYSEAQPRDNCCRDRKTARAIITLCTISLEKFIQPLFALSSSQLNQRKCMMA